MNFGWSMPAGAWASTLPGEEDNNKHEDEPEICQCGRNLSTQPTRTEPWEQTVNGEIVAAGTAGIWECECGATTRVNLA